MELVDMRDLGSRAFSVWVRVPSGAPYERGPFFEHFYRKTDLSFFESLATAGLFLFALFQCSYEKAKNFALHILYATVDTLFQR